MRTHRQLTAIYVTPARLRSTNPGYCFLVAGWRRCGWTKSGRLILEKT